MNDSANYSNPSVFDGFRFVTKSEEVGVGCQAATKQTNKVSDVSTTFLFWGYGKEAWSLTANPETELSRNIQTLIIAQSREILCHIRDEVDSGPLRQQV